MYRIHSDSTNFYFEFTNDEDKQKILEVDPIFIRGKMFIVKQWTPSFASAKEQVRTVPIWVLFRNIPLITWSLLGINWLACHLGQPVCFNEQTESLDRLDYARCLVEITADRIPLDHIMCGDVNDQTKVTVHYDWLPQICVDCKVFGHDKNSCTTVGNNDIPMQHRFEARTIADVVSSVPLQRSSIPPGSIKVKKRKLWIVKRDKKIQNSKVGKVDDGVSPITGEASNVNEQQDYGMGGSESIDKAMEHIQEDGTNVSAAYLTRVLEVGGASVDKQLGGPDVLTDVQIEPNCEAEDKEHEQAMVPPEELESNCDSNLRMLNLECNQYGTMSPYMNIKLPKVISDNLQIAQPTPAMMECSNAHVNEGLMDVDHSALRSNRTSKMSARKENGDSTIVVIPTETIKHAVDVQEKDEQISKQKKVTKKKLKRDKEKVNDQEMDLDNGIDILEEECTPCFILKGIGKLATPTTTRVIRSKRLTAKKVRFSPKYNNE